MPIADWVIWQLLLEGKF